MAKGGKAGPVVTDNGNFVIDAPFDAETMQDPHEVCHLHYSSTFDIRGLTKGSAEQLLQKIKMLTGVVEVGLFCGMAQAAYFGNAVRSFSILRTSVLCLTIFSGRERDDQVARRSHREGRHASEPTR